MIPLFLDIPNGWKTAIMIVLMILVFYFFLIRPQSQKTKQETEYRNGLKPGDEVMTQGGIHARFVSTQGAMALVDVAPGTRIKVQLASLNPIPERKSKK
ncbi:MAG: preprotein translocase subunit YajC [Bacteroidales bacterium]|nr:preprotein translocase subunit YajC [Bacteroidales bacterium]